MRSSGLQGAPALKYMALCLCCEAGLRLPEAAPAGLDGGTVELIDRRAREAVAPYVDMFPLRRRHEPEPWSHRFGGERGTDA